MDNITALVGNSGFVGSNLIEQMNIDELYNSSNSVNMRNRQYSTVFFCAARAEKWKANSNPAADRQHINELFNLLKSFEAKRLVLISTVDVYPVPRNVNESTPIEHVEDINTYGKHRFELEHHARQVFETINVIRLPALFGPGLKKNAIFDLKNNNNISQINPEAIFQFYNINYLAADISRAISENIPLLNICSEPIRIGDIAKELFAKSIESNPVNNPSVYDVQSSYASNWGQDNYLYSRQSILNDLTHYLKI